MRTVPKSLSVNFFDPSDLKPITSLPSESSELPRLVELGVGAKVLVGQQAPKKVSSRRLWCFNLHDAIRHWWNSSGSCSNTSAAGFGVGKNILQTEYLIHEYTFSITHFAGKYNGLTSNISPVPVRLSLHVMAATRRSRGQLGLIFTGQIWSRYSLTKHHQHNSLSEHWNFPPPNHLATSCHIQHPGNNFQICFSPATNPTAKLGVDWTPRIKHPTFEKPNLQNLFQTIFLFIRGDFRVCWFWMVLVVVHFHTRRAIITSTKTKTKLETFSLFLFFLSRSNLRSNNILLTLKTKVISTSQLK